MGIASVWDIFFSPFGSIMRLRWAIQFVIFLTGLAHANQVQIELEKKQAIEINVMIKVSIVTISYNQAHFLKRTIKSVRRQDYPNIEHIIVDPGSTDGSRKIIEQYRDHFAAIIFEPDEGPADGLQKGIQASTGDILAQLNSDDCYFPGAITRVSREFQEDSSLGVLYGNGIVADFQGSPVKYLYADLFTAKRFVYGQVAVFQQATFYRRWAYSQVGGFNVREQNLLGC